MSTDFNCNFLNVYIYLFLYMVYICIQWIIVKNYLYAEKLIKLLNEKEVKDFYRPNFKCPDFYIPNFYAFLIHVDPSINWFSNNFKTSCKAASIGYVDDLNINRNIEESPSSQRAWVN